MIQSSTNVDYDFLIQLQLKSWTTHINRVTDLLNNLSDEAISRDIAPGKNSGTYVLGHLVAVHDAMLPLLDLGKALYPELYATFVRTPDKSGHSFPSITELKTKWADVNDKLNEHFSGMTAADWLSRHTSVSPEDFAREPHRNKLNVLISRTTHLSYHYGQLVLLK